VRCNDHRLSPWNIRNDRTILLLCFCIVFEFPVASAPLIVSGSCRSRFAHAKLWLMFPSLMFMFFFLEKGGGLPPPPTCPVCFKKFPVQRMFLSVGGNHRMIITVLITVFPRKVNFFSVGVLHHWSFFFFQPFLSKT